MKQDSWREFWFPSLASKTLTRTSNEDVRVDFSDFHLRFAKHQEANGNYKTGC